MTLPPDALFWLRLTAIPLAIWSALTALEWIAVREAFDPEGVLRQPAASGRIDRWRRLGRSQVVSIAVGRLAAAAVLLAASSPGWLAMGFAATALLSPLVGLATDHYAGADKMGQIVAVAGTFAATGIARGDGWLAFAGVLLAGGQLAISYAVAGVAKLRFAEWRDGRALVAVMRGTETGHALAARLLERRGVARGFCLPFLLGETLFPLALAAPPWALATALASFALFHLATGWLMGLNTFAWSFLAAYPALWLLGRAVRSIA